MASTSPAGNSPPVLSQLPSPPSSSADVASTSFAFLVHSQDTILHNLPPGVDNKPLARQRRRRTSPEDQRILEAEFLRDPKPNKDARQRIVALVALGDKEVQIWFQNRRQNNRRKTRPSSSHEVEEHTASSQGSHVEERPASPTLPTTPQVDGHKRESASCISTDQSFLTQAFTKGGNMVLPISQNSREDAEFVRENELAPSNEEESITLAVQPNTSIMQEAEGQWSEGKTTIEERGQYGRVDDDVSATSNHNTLNTGSNPGVSSAKVQPPPNLKRATSNIRLSMASDGSARIVTGEEASPSPPRSQPIPTLPTKSSGKLRRSYSAAGLHDHFSTARSRRSRDSRAWEFWCDGDAGGDLMRKADQEQTGSAADAISLMRSNSRSILTSKVDKVNLRLDLRAPLRQARNDRSSIQVPGLGRAKSSIARIEGGTKVSDHNYVGEHETHKSECTIRSIESMVLPNDDSDKENQEPPNETPSSRPRTTFQNRSRALLRRAESKTVPSQSSKSISNVHRPRARRQSKAHADENEGIAIFMRGAHSASGHGSMSGDDDLDCVQGLLSLSQGNWK